MAAWLKQIGVPVNQVVDIWGFQKFACAKFASTLVRVRVGRSLTISNVYGVDGFLAKELPGPSRGSKVSFGDINWLHLQEGESGPDMLKRALDLANGTTLCRGLAFSNSGSIGVRVGEGACNSSRRAKHLPTYVDIEQFAAWLAAVG